MDGLTSFANISTTFPNISSCRLMASDQEVEHLIDLPHLRQLEVGNHFKDRETFSLPQVEFSDGPDVGFFSFLTEHPNRARFTQLFIEVGKKIFEPENSEYHLALKTLFEIEN